MYRHKRLFNRISACAVILTLITVLYAPVRAAESNTLTLIFGQEGAVFSLYRAADLKPDGSYAFSGQFADCPAELPGYDWLETAAEVAAYAADKQPDAQTEISGGSLTFTGLSEGLYLVTGAPLVSEGIRYTPVPFLVRVENGNMTSYVKSDQEPVEEPAVSYQVKKVWKDDAAKDRPDSVSVQLLKDNAVVQTVTLSAENGWSYSWTDTGEHTWQVRELQVPEGYTASVTQSGNSFTVINTFISATSSHPSESPGTGDGSALWPAAILFLTSGIMLITLLKRNKQHA